MAIFDDDYCSSNFSQLSDLWRWRYLVRQNAYFIWERRTAEGRTDTPADNWTAAEAYVAGYWTSWFSPGFLEFIGHPQASKATSP
mgnify:CR=1 FL=1